MCFFFFVVVCLWVVWDRFGWVLERERERSYCVFIGEEWTCWSATTESYSKKTYFFLSSLLSIFFLSASTCHMDQFAWEPTNGRQKEFGCARLEKITSVVFWMGYWMRRNATRIWNTHKCVYDENELDGWRVVRETAVNKMRFCCRSWNETVKCIYRLSWILCLFGRHFGR